MKKIAIILIISLSILTTITQGKNDYKSITIQRAYREIELNGRYVETEIKLDLKNTGSDEVSDFFYAIATELKKNTVLVLIESNGIFTEGKSVQDISLTAHNTSLILFDLETPIQPGELRTITLRETFYNRFEPYPAQITLLEDQLVRFRDNKYFFTPYVVEKQSVLYKVKSTRSYTEDDSITKVKNGMKYGDFGKIAPFTRNEIVIHYENNTPLVVLKKVTQTIQVSHWGNIAIETAYKLANEGAILTGQFGRVDYNKWNPQTGKSALKNLYAELPFTSWGVYYTDEIGNISTSTAARSTADQVVKLDIQPRFPVFGGWKSNWVVGYNLNTSRYLRNDNNKYILKQLFSFPFLDLIAEEFELQVILPEGATQLSYDIPFGIDSKSQETTFSYLDTKGRPTLVFSKKQVTDHHNQDFYVTYHLSASDIYRKPLLILGAFGVFFFGLIFLRRFQLETFQSQEE